MLRFSWLVPFALVIACSSSTTTVSAPAVAVDGGENEDAAAVFVEPGAGAPDAAPDSGAKPELVPSAPVGQSCTAFCASHKTTCAASCKLPSGAARRWREHQHRRHRQLLEDDRVRDVRADRDRRPQGHKHHRKLLLPHHAGEDGGEGADGSDDGFIVAPRARVERLCVAELQGAPRNGRCMHRLPGGGSCCS